MNKSKRLSVALASLREGKNPDGKSIDIATIASRTFQEWLKSQSHRALMRENQGRQVVAIHTTLV
jgi:hypothetical protein